MKVQFVCVALLGTLVLSATAEAKGLKEKKARKDAMTIVKESRDVEDMKKNCGVDKVDLKIDFESFSKAKAVNKSFSHRSVVHYCINAVDALGDLCKDPDAKEAVTEQVKSLQCKFDDKATKDQIKRYGPVLKLKKGKLSVGYNEKTANFKDGTKEWLLNNL